MEMEVQSSPCLSPLAPRKNSYIPPLMAKENEVVVIGGSSNPEAPPEGNSNELNQKPYVGPP